LKKLVIEGIYLNIIKAVYDKHIANGLLNVEIVKLFPVTSGERQGCPHSPLLFNQYSARILSQSNRPRERKRGCTIGKEEIKLSLFAYDMILYLKDPEDSIKKLLDLINTFGKVAGYKISI
jgi:hypothetical protein